MPHLLWGVQPRIHTYIHIDSPAHMSHLCTYATDSGPREGIYVHKYIHINIHVSLIMGRTAAPRKGIYIPTYIHTYNHTCLTYYGTHSSPTKRYLHFRNLNPLIFVS